MKNRSRWLNGSVMALSVVLLGGMGSAAFAQHAGGGHFGGNAGGHAAVGGYRGGGYGYGGYRGGGYGYGGYRGGYGGYRGGWGYGGWGYRGGYYGGWGWGGVGLGLYFAALPLYYSTYWWGGVPYYYANDVYYRYDDSMGQYETVTPPAEVSAQVPAGSQGGGTDLMAYPKNGQSSEQQGKDKYECHHWAASQSGFDPTQGSPSSATAARRGDYMRAQAACLEGRGYSVR